MAHGLGVPWTQLTTRSLRDRAWVTRDTGSLAGWLLRGSRRRGLCCYLLSVICYLLFYYEYTHPQAFSARVAMRQHRACTTSASARRGRTLNTYPRIHVSNRMAARAALFISVGNVQHDL